MEKCKWSFQLLLEVFCSYTLDCPAHTQMSSPIISNVILRDENVEFEFPFQYTFVLDDEKRISDNGVFKQTNDDIIFECEDDTFHLTHIDIGSIITRHQLLYS